MVGSHLNPGFAAWVRSGMAVSADAEYVDIELFTFTEDAAGLWRAHSGTTRPQHRAESFLPFGPSLNSGAGVSRGPVSSPWRCRQRRSSEFSRFVGYLLNHCSFGNVVIEVTAVREQHSLMDYLGGAGAGAGAVVESFNFGS